MSTQEPFSEMPKSAEIFEFFYYQQLKIADRGMLGAEHQSTIMSVQQYGALPVSKVISLVDRVNPQ